MKASKGKVLLRYAAHKGSKATITPPVEVDCDDLDDARREFASSKTALERAGFTLFFADVWDDSGREGRKIAELIERNYPSQ